MRLLPAHHLCARHLRPRPIKQRTNRTAHELINRTQLPRRGLKSWGWQGVRRASLVRFSEHFLVVLNECVDDLAYLREVFHVPD